MNIIWFLLALGLAFRLWLLYEAHSMRRYVREQLRKPLPETGPAVTLIAPCKGIDPGLEQNVQAMLAQQYPGWWQIIFVVESETDPAYELLQRNLARTRNQLASLIIAGAIKDGLSQKIHNMLAAMEVADQRSEVFAFIDSDVRPRPDWLAYLVDPLKEEKHPASGGYRWYIPLEGGWATATRAVWNLLVSVVGDPRRRANAWGGSFAVRRKDLQEMGIDERWRKVFSEDMTLSEMVRQAGKTVAFVVQCVIPSHEDCTWRECFDFIRRQTLVGRVYAPVMWYGGWVLSLAYLGPLVAAIVAGIWYLGSGQPAGYLMLAGAALLYGLGTVLGSHARRTVQIVLPKCDSSKIHWMYSFGLEWIILVALAGLIASTLSRKMLWRGRVYTLLSDQKTLVE